MTISQLEERVSSSELTRWIAYAGIEPFGYPMDNYRMGVSTQEIVNSVRSTIPVAKGARRPPRLKAESLYPVHKTRGPDLTPEQQEHIRKKHGKRRK